MKEVIKYICEECESEYTQKIQAILCEKSHAVIKKLKNYDKRVIEVVKDMYYFKANSSEDLRQCIDIYFKDCLWYSEKDFDNYKYPCDFLLRITMDIYTNKYIVVINELSEILGKIGDALNKSDI